MGFEVLLVIPVIVIIGITIVRNCKKTLFKNLHFFGMVFIILFFLFVYPSPFAFQTRKPYIYWTGCKPGPAWYKIERGFKWFCARYLDLEFVE